MECLRYPGGGNRYLQSSGSVGVLQDSLSGCFPAAASIWQQGGRSRKPIAALAATASSGGGSCGAGLGGFWGGPIAELREALFPAAAGSQAKFYVGRSEEDLAAAATSDPEEERFFREITTLSRRQTLLFQRSCEQLKELYHARDGAADAAATLSVAPSVTASAAPRPVPAPRTLPRPSSRLGGGGGVTPPGPSPFGDDDGGSVEELYQECLYCVMHMIGCDAARDSQWQLVEHLRKAFR